MNNLEELNNRIAELRMECREDEQKLQQHWQFLQQNAGKIAMEKLLGINPESTLKIAGATQLFRLLINVVLPFLLPEAKWSSRLISGLRTGSFFIPVAAAVRNFLKKKNNTESGAEE